ncbi:TPA: aminodeoxychorismate/anthranilate synthase component II [Candidatus Sumerlaeota bacterium]|nr:aminodeoxychorismate/anthranilate synthase component II [Candidatus Sumerlaeota bacterium]
MFLVVDNYDSFTWNLVHYIGELGAEMKVVRNDKITVDEVVKLDPEGIVLSPGPCTPNEAGICLDLIAAAAEAKVPLLGVCLGHQAIGQVFGAAVVRAPRPVHGKTSMIEHDGRGVFSGLGGPFAAGRYHSLAVSEDAWPDGLEVAARAAEDGVVMALRHRTWPVHGVQFHPESIMTNAGKTILTNFLAIK